MYCKPPPPSDPVVLRRAGFIASGAEKKSEALEHYRQATQQDPTDFEALLNYALLANEFDSERSVALSKLNGALRESPRNVPAAYASAILSARAQRPEQARAGWTVVARYAREPNLRKMALNIVEGATLPTSEPEEESSGEN